MKKIFIGIPAYSHITPETLQTIQRLGQNTKNAQVLSPFVLYNQSVVSFARNIICESFLASDADYLFFIDSDIFIKKDFDALDKLIEADKDIISGVYVCRNAPYNPAVMTYERAINGSIFETFKQDRAIQVLYCVTGFTLIKRRVIEKLSPNPFNLRYYPEKEKNEYQMPEDYSFCAKAKQFGFDSYIHAGFELFHLGAYGYTLQDFYYICEKNGLKPGDKLPNWRATL